MPEGPSIRILKEEADSFKNKKVIKATGTAKIDIKRLNGEKIIDLKTFGKQFLICFKGFTVRVHLLLFGTYRVNETRDMKPRLSLQFAKGQLNFYSCSVKLIEEDLDEVYEWDRDIMSDKWKPAKAVKSVKEAGDELVCDILLDQDVFAGSGNIIKNEVLFLARLHPLNHCDCLPDKKIKELAKTTREYAFDFYKWKKNYELKKHWQAYAKKTCPRCHIPLQHEYLGKHKRRTFWCNNCQILH